MPEGLGADTQVEGTELEHGWDLHPSFVVGAGQGLCPLANQIGGETGKETGAIWRDQVL